MLARKLVWFGLSQLKDPTRAKLDANLDHVYVTWLVHRGWPGAEVNRWIERGVQTARPTATECKMIAAARLVREPVVCVSVDLPLDAEVSFDELDIECWQPRGELTRLTVDGQRCTRVYIRALPLEKLPELAAVASVIRINYAPLEWMQAYR